MEGFTGWPSTKSLPPFHRGRLPALRTSKKWGCSALRCCCCCSGVRSLSRPQVVSASLVLALKTALQASTVLNFSSSRAGQGVAAATLLQGKAFAGKRCAPASSTSMPSCELSSLAACCYRSSRLSPSFPAKFLRTVLNARCYLCVASA